MAKILGESGRYTSQEEIKLFRRHYLFIISVIGFLGAILGYLICLQIQADKISSIAILSAELFLILAIYFADKLGFRKLEEIEKRRIAMRKGSEGENKTAKILQDFPDGFHVINSLTTQFGDLDHIIIGPTGVFVLDTKNWKGVVLSDGKGELLLNGKPTPKPTIKPLVIRMMKVREKVQTLCNFEPPFFKAVLVFPSARVDAKWGTTGNANCIRDEQLWDYIVENKITANLNSNEIEKLAQAFLALATMDKEFSSKTNSESTVA